MENKIEKVDPEEILRRLDQLISFLKNKERKENKPHEIECKITN